MFFDNQPLANAILMILHSFARTIQRKPVCIFNGILVTNRTTINLPLFAHFLNLIAFRYKYYSIISGC